jgi:hypothetical protein
MIGRRVKDRTPCSCYETYVVHAVRLAEETAISFLTAADVLALLEPHHGAVDLGS